MARPHVTWDKRTSDERAAYRADRAMALHRYEVERERLKKLKVVKPVVKPWWLRKKEAQRDLDAAEAYRQGLWTFYNDAGGPFISEVAANKALVAYRKKQAIARRNAKGNTAWYLLPYSHPLKVAKRKEEALMKLGKLPYSHARNVAFRKQAAQLKLSAAKARATSMKPRQPVEKYSMWPKVEKCRYPECAPKPVYVADSGFIPDDRAWMLPGGVVQPPGTLYKIREEFIQREPEIQDRSLFRVRPPSIFPKPRGLFDAPQ